MKINNGKKLEKINRTCQSTAHLTARPMHGTVNEIGKVIDGWVMQQFPNHKMKAERILSTASEPKIHRNNRLTRPYYSRISDDFIAKKSWDKN